MKRAGALVVVLGLVAVAAMGLGRPAEAQVLGNRFTYPLTAPTVSATRFTSTAASGSNGFACTVDGCRLDLGTGANDYLYSTSGVVTTPGSIQALGNLYGNIVTKGGAAGSLVVQGAVGDGATAIAVKLTNSNALTTSGAKVVAFYSDNGTTEKASIDKNGSGVFLGFVSSADSLRLTNTSTLPTCGASYEGGIFRQSGGTTGARTKLCLCTSDGAGTPAYAWKNITRPDLTDAASIGTTTTCP